MLDSENSGENLKMPVVALNASIATNKPLDSIVELNYEASSDEEHMLAWLKRQKIIRIFAILKKDHRKRQPAINSSASGSLLTNKQTISIS